MPSRNAQQPQEECEKCLAVTATGERCKNSTCKESNKPLCAIHVKKLTAIMSDLHSVSHERRNQVMQPLSEYLIRRNIDFVINLVNIPSNFDAERMQKLRAWQDSVLDTYNKMNIKQKCERLAKFTSYLSLRGADYQLELKNE